MPPSTSITLTTTVPVKKVPPSYIAGLKAGDERKSNKSSDIYRETIKTEYKWANIILIYAIHFITLVGFVRFPYLSHKATLCCAVFFGILGGFGVTGGAHRLWCHRAFKAKLPLRIILMICYSIAGQNRLIDWVRDHRVHHKFTETDADPHNSNRGFFFAHVGWLMQKKHPEVIRRGKQIDCSDLWMDSVVVFYERYFWTLKLLWCFAIPIAIPCYFWNETFNWSLVVCLARYVCNLNFTWLVNSVAHMFGCRPYNRDIGAVENRLVSFLAMGEGWHNYHHTFPWDYRSAELGMPLNLTTTFLDLFAKIGWAYDLKYPAQETIKKCASTRGDGTHYQWGHEVPESAAITLRR